MKARVHADTRIERLAEAVDALTTGRATWRPTASQWALTDGRVDGLYVYTRHPPPASLGATPDLVGTIPDDGITVRFLTEPDGWLGYYEIWDRAIGRFVPHVSGDPIQRGSKMRDVLAANTLVVSEGPLTGAVVALSFKMDRNLAIALAEKSDEHLTLMDRDYEIHARADGSSVEYDVFAARKSRRSLISYSLLDLEEVVLNDGAAARTPK